VKAIYLLIIDDKLNKRKIKPNSQLKEKLKIRKIQSINKILK
jgi:hypothetical protein